MKLFIGIEVQQKKGNIYEASNKLHVYNLKSIENRPPYRKIVDFYKFSKYVRDIIKQKQYDKLVILTTMSAMILLPELLSKYKKRYIFDYRDASYEYRKVFKGILSRIIDNSYFTCISSRGFLKILPKGYNYVLVHNISDYETNEKKELVDKERYTIGFIGGLRESEYMKKLIDIFGNDPRFDFVVHGGGENYQELDHYFKKYDNVLFTGFYNEKDKRKLYESVDIICYNYTESFNNNVALANKFYDALIERKPLLGNIKTYSGKLIQNNNLGISLELSDPRYKEKLYNYIKHFDYELFNEKCDIILNQVKLDNKLYVEKIEEFFCNS